MNTKNILYNAALSGSLLTSTDENASFASMKITLTVSLTISRCEDKTDIHSTLVP